MSDKENECWKLLNRELQEAKAKATTREAYPLRTRFDQGAYDRLAAEAWRRCRERMDALRRFDAETEATVDHVALASAQTMPNPLLPLEAIVAMPAATSDSGPSSAAP